MLYQFYLKIFQKAITYKAKGQHCKIGELIMIKPKFIEMIEHRADRSPLKY